jgi:protein kinase A
MPTFGSLLKKKKTKDSTGGRDEPTPKSPVKETIQRENTNTISLESSKTAASTAPSQATTAVASSSEAKPNDDSMNKSSPSKGPQIANLVNASDGAAESTAEQRQLKGKYTLTDFAIQRTLGTGSFGRVHLVQSKHNQRYYAIKVLKKQQVVKMKQIEHTNDERKMLQRVKHPFLITLWGTFQDSKNLYMVMDFIEGGELFSLLRKSQVGYPVPNQHVQKKKSMS